MIGICAVVLPDRIISCRTKSVCWQEVDEGWAGYCERTGTTFLIDPVSRFVFDIICEAGKGLRLPELSHLLEHNIPEPGNWKQLDAVLGILVSAGLIDCET